MISIETKVNESVVNYGLVNNVLVFNTFSKLDSVKADLEFFGIKKTIRPAPDGSYFYNLKPWISALFSEKGFEDNVRIDLEDSGFVYNVTDFALIKGDVKVTMYLTDSSKPEFLNSVYFLNGLKQKEDLNKRIPSNFNRNLIFPLHPLADWSNRRMYLNYWAGYPMDITIHKGTGSTKTKFTNNSTLSEFELTTGVNDAVSRYVFSDGRDEIGLAQKFNITQGYNEITVSSGTDSFELIINRIDKCKSGVYIKWLNNDGGYSYYFFHKANRFRKTSDLGSIENDYYNIEDTVSPVYNIGKESADEIKVVLSCVEPEQHSLLNELMESPAVFLFTGVPYNKNTYKDWISLKMLTSNVKTENAKQRLNNYEFVFETPKRNTRTL